LAYENVQATSSDNETHIYGNSWPLTQNLTKSNTFLIPHFNNFFKSIALFSSLMTQRHRVTPKAVTISCQLIKRSLFCRLCFCAKPPTYTHDRHSFRQRNQRHNSLCLEEASLTPHSLIKHHENVNPFGLWDNIFK